MEIITFIGVGSLATILFFSACALYRTRGIPLD